MSEHRSHIDDKIAAMLAKTAAGPKKRFSHGFHGGCAGKDAYPNESAARAIALMNGTANKLLTYRCDTCDLWHFTKRQ